MKFRKPSEFSIWGKNSLPHAAVEIGTSPVGHAMMKLEVHMTTVAHIVRIYTSMENAI
jgi:hypothetical protein